MTARPAWQPGDLSPEAQSAAEAAAEAAGVPLAQWLAETVRAALLRELGSLPPEDQPASPAPEERAAPEPPLPAMVPSANMYRPGPISLEAQRLAGSGLTGWLASRIERMPAGAARPRVLAPPAIVPLALPAGPLTTLAVAALRPARIRSRRAADPDPAIPALAASIAVQGVREPILARRATEGAGVYEVVAGERRRLAAERVGRADLPAVIVTADAAETLMLSLMENLGRGDFSPLDEGRAYLRLLTEYRVSPSTLTERVARERSEIVRTLRLLGLPETVRQLIDGGRLSAAQAYALLDAADPVATAEHMMTGEPA
jgi:ParB family chromosome partitioning protein